MLTIAHIGDVPVEEWVPFLVPVLALYLYGRRRDRRRREQVDELPEASELLDERTVEQLRARLRERGHGDIAARHLRLLYPPGPDGRSAAEIAASAHEPEPAVMLMLDELAELGYLEHQPGGNGEERVWLTVEGHDVLNTTESVLLAAASVRRQAQHDSRSRGAQASPR